ncbi:MAG: hypothetical protein H6707_03230 [Deltaproteobacteria bacterium]|nr:hypothetical protein [Deltaproteobacteria bacterium]
MRNYKPALILTLLSCLGGSARAETTPLVAELGLSDYEVGLVRRLLHHRQGALTVAKQAVDQLGRYVDATQTLEQQIDTLLMGHPYRATHFGYARKERQRTPLYRSYSGFASLYPARLESGVLLIHSKAPNQTDPTKIISNLMPSKDYRDNLWFFTTLRPEQAKNTPHRVEAVSLHYNNNGESVVHFDYSDRSDRRADGGNLRLKSVNLSTGAVETASYREHGGNGYLPHHYDNFMAQERTVLSKQQLRQLGIYRRAGQGRLFRKGK